MNIQEIIEQIKQIIPVLMYDGYRTGEEKQLFEDGSEILWPREVKASLKAYCQKTGIYKEVLLRDEDIKNNNIIELPWDFRELNYFSDSKGSYIRTTVNTIDENGNFVFPKLSDRPGTNNSKKALHFQYLNNDTDDIVYPLKLSYFIDLTAYLTPNYELPNNVDTSVLTDYLEATVGMINSQYQTSVEMYDVDMKQKTREEYEQQKKEAEEKIQNLKVLPPIGFTN